MFGNRIKIFNFRGVPVKVSIFVFIVIGLFMLPSGVLFTFGFSGGAFGLLSLVLLPLGMFLSVFLHEIAHALAGHWTGSTVTEIQVDVLGGATVFATRPPAYEKDLLICMAGPLTNLALWKIFDVAAVASISSLYDTFSFLATLNLILAVFNALPIYPFDGGQATYAFVMWLTSRQKFAAGVVITLSAGLVGYLLFLPPPFLRGDIIFAVFMWWTALSIALSCYGLYQHAAALANFYPLPEQQYEYARRKSLEWDDKSRAEKFFLAGMAQWNARQYAWALGSFTQAWELEPKEPAYREWRAAAYLEVHEYFMALEDYNQLIKANPNKPELYLGRARVYKQLGNLNQARTELTMALQLSPANLPARALQLELGLPAAS